MLLGYAVHAHSLATTWMGSLGFLAAFLLVICHRAWALGILRMGTCAGHRVRRRRCRAAGGAHAAKREHDRGSRCSPASQGALRRRAPPSWSWAHGGSSGTRGSARRGGRARGRGGRRARRGRAESQAEGRHPTAGVLCRRRRERERATPREGEQVGERGSGKRERASEGATERGRDSGTQER